MSKNRKKSYTCPICRVHGFVSDTEFILFRAPNGEFDYCCPTCYSQILNAHYRLLRNMAWNEKCKREMEKEKKKKEKELVCA